MKKKRWKMHFREGKPCVYDGERYDEEREVEEFEDEIKIIAYGRGCSSAVFYGKSLTTNTEYQIFMSDMIDIIYNSERGVVRGTFTFCKKGSNYGVKLVKPKDK